MYNPADTKTSARIHYATIPANQRIFTNRAKQITTIQLQVTVTQDTDNINLFF